MTIGEVRKILQQTDKYLEVYYDFGHLYPISIGSWRGCNSEPALGWSDDRNFSATVEDVLKEIDLAVSGKLYEGYKGGKFTFKDSDTLHIDNYGESSNTEIDSIDTSDYCVIIRTRKE